MSPVRRHPEAEQDRGGASSRASPPCKLRRPAVWTSGTADVLAPWGVTGRRLRHGRQARSAEPLVPLRPWAPVPRSGRSSLNARATRPSPANPARLLGVRPSGLLRPPASLPAPPRPAHLSRGSRHGPPCRVHTPAVPRLNWLEQSSEETKHVSRCPRGTCVQSLPSPALRWDAGC